MLKNFICILAGFLLICSQPSWSETFSVNAHYQVCFTPGQDCTQEIIKVLDRATQKIYVQAYSFTSQPIAAALVAAKNRGVDVKIILDKSQYRAEKYSSAKFLDNHGIPLWIDAKPAIAHNKVMIIDEKIVVTGSFNFTKAAQQKNAENLLIINDAFLATQYLHNWKIRQTQSYPLDDYHPYLKALS